MPGISALLRLQLAYGWCPPQSLLVPGFFLPLNVAGDTEAAHGFQDSRCTVYIKSLILTLSLSSLLEAG